MLKYYYLLIPILFLGSCSLTDNDNPIPTYIIINDVSVFTTPDEGDPTHNITDVWITADNELLGVFPLPAKIPVIAKGDSTKLRISPGFRNNGEASRSFTYNLMNPQELVMALTPGQEVELSLTFTYIDNAIFDFVESFEGSGHIFTLDLDGDDVTNIEISDESAVAGTNSGKISLDRTNSFISAGTIFKYEGSQNAGSDSYLEMDYKCDMPFFVGVIYIQEGQEVSQPLLFVNPKEDWNKLYVDFTEILTSPLLESYRIYFTTDLEPLTGQETGEIFLDNLKFIHL